MTPIDRKAAFRTAAAQHGHGLHAAAFRACDVTWYHLSEGLENRRALSDEVKQKFAAYIGRPVSEVFGESADDAAA